MLLFVILGLALLVIAVADSLATLERIRVAAPAEPRRAAGGLSKEDPQWT